MRLFGLVIWLVACAREQQLDKSTLGSDADQDGFTAQEDCDDRDPFVYPGAEEVCDGRDNNCNGEVDEGVLFVYYPDFDGDGFGDDAASITSCSLPAQYITVGNDCDDNDASINPGAGELCDEIDNDCDNEIDEDLTDGFFLDEDGDGYGNVDIPAEDCQRLSEYVDNGIDCDDSDSEIFPFASEVCDEIDNDCDGVIDEAGSGISLWYADTDNDGYGNLFDAMNACVQPEGYVANSEDCDDEDGGQYPGADEVCNDEDDNCNGEIDENPVEAFVYYQDADNDGFGLSSVTQSACSQPVGYISNDGDCDDSNPSISPSAPEICNNQDDDCDGIIDDQAIGMVTLYADTDGDGYGDLNQSLASCSANVAGYVVNSLDCNDDDAAQNPLGTEVCNSQDDNCNGFVDEGASDASTWFLDQDGDGYGDFSVWEVGCQEPLGYVSAAGDCDDSDPAYSPATPETCDGTDENCNGFVDEGVATYQWYYDTDGDGYGDPFSVLESCAQLTGMTADNSDCDDSNADIHPGMDELCNDGLDNNCDGYLDDESSVDAFVGYLDTDGDGYGGGMLLSSCDDIYYSTDDDCDDEDADVYPEATEICDGIDNDCDGDIDSNWLCRNELSYCRLRRRQGSSYLFCRANRTWSVAKGECASLGYHLVTINDSGEDAWIDGQIDNFSSSRRWWIGYNDITLEDYWDWDGPYGTYTNWSSGEPNNAGSGEDCVLLNQTNTGSWNDASCSTSTYFVCEANP